MAYGHAMLGETPELYRDAVEWGKAQEEQMQKSDAIRQKINKNIAPVLERRREAVLKKQK